MIILGPNLKLVSLMFILNKKNMDNRKIYKSMN